MNHLAFLSAAGLLACGTCAQAADANAYWDYRFGIGGEPALTKAEYDPDGSPNYDSAWDASGGSLEFNVAHRLQAANAHSAFVTFGGFIRGFDGSDDPDTGDDISLGIVGVQGGGGYSFHPDPRYALEIGPHLGLGLASATETTMGADIDSDTGGYARLDFGVANYFNFGRFQLGATIGVASWAASVRYPAQDIYSPSAGWGYFPGADVTYRGSGAYLSLSAGFR